MGTKGHHLFFNDERMIRVSLHKQQLRARWQIDSCRRRQHCRMLPMKSRFTEAWAQPPPCPSLKVNAAFGQGIGLYL